MEEKGTLRICFHQGPEETDWWADVSFIPEGGEEYPLGEDVQLKDNACIVIDPTCMVCELQTTVTTEEGSQPTRRGPTNPTPPAGDQPNKGEAKPAPGTPPRRK